MPSVLRYVPKTHCNEGETPFSGCTSGNARGKDIKKEIGPNPSTLKESVTLPTRNMYQPKVNRLPLPGFIPCSRTLLDKEENLPNA